MNRPLIISDCDEVLLHMIAPFRDWLGDMHAIDFAMDSNDFSQAMRRRSDGALVEPAEIWRYLNLFFDTEMPRQQAIAGAVEAMAVLREHADLVILTNLKDHRQESRAAQLRGVGIDARVFTNQGPKARRCRRSSTNTAPAARCSSTIWPSTTIRSPPSRRTSPGCTCAASPCSPRISPVPTRPGTPMPGSTAGTGRLPWLLDQLAKEPA